MSPYEQAKLDGYVDEIAIAAGAAVAWRSSEYPEGLRHRDFNMRKGHMLPVEAESPPNFATLEKMPAPEPPKCAVDGVAVTELAVLVKPVAFFVTTNNGTHEVGRCYFQGGEFKYGVDVTRIGGCTTRRVEYNTREGLRIHFDKGYEMFIPVSHCQGTWRTATE